MAVKTINNIARLDGLIPTLLIFGTYPRISREDRPTTSNVERAAIIKKVMAKVHRCYNTRKIINAINIRNSPNITATLALLLNSDVLVQRENELYQSGLYKLVIIYSYIYKVQVNNKIINFRITSIKPYKTDEKEELLEGNILPNSLVLKRLFSIPYITAG